MSKVETTILLSVFMLLAGLSVWLQYALLEPETETAQRAIDNDPDYYIENFRITGNDKEGQTYFVEADRMVHFPQDGTALLDNPHIIQYLGEAPPRHIYATTGRMTANGDEIVMEGEVRVIQGSGAATGGVMQSNRMKIRLRDKKS